MNNTMLRNPLKMHPKLPIERYQVAHYWQRPSLTKPNIYNYSLIVDFEINSIGPPVLSNYISSFINP